MPSIRRRRIYALSRVVVQFLDKILDSAVVLLRVETHLEVGIHDNLLLVGILERLAPLDCFAFSACTSSDSCTALYSCDIASKNCGRGKSDQVATISV